MKKIIFISMMFIFSCTDGENGVNSIKNQSKPLLASKEDTFTINDNSSSEKNEMKRLKYRQDRYNQDIFEFIKECEQKLNSKGYKLLSKLNTEQYKRSQILNDDFTNISYEAQLDEGKNKIISFILYEYKDKESAVKLFNELAYHKYQDGIFKSGALLIHHSKYLLQIASTCSIDIDSWESIKNNLEVELPYIYCFCGGECTIEF